MYSRRSNVQTELVYSDVAIQSHTPEREKSDFPYEGVYWVDSYRFHSKFYSVERG